MPVLQLTTTCHHHLLGLVGSGRWQGDQQVQQLEGFSPRRNPLRTAAQAADSSHLLQTQVRGHKLKWILLALFIQKSLHKIVFQVWSLTQFLFC